MVCGCFAYKAKTDTDLRSVVEGKWLVMKRQCAWCLRLIDELGLRLSSSPVPKTYDASHGMCKICADVWLEEVLQDTEKQPALLSRPARSDVTSFTDFWQKTPLL